MFFRPRLKVRVTQRKSFVFLFLSKSVKTAKNQFDGITQQALSAAPSGDSTVPVLDEAVRSNAAA